ncbi:hypothetical protein MCOR27_000404 [Pyricularia oryzae]|uniref:F-box domain-containing protein n=2 Tax=Pyricularia TaxID=48558 RepID=A0ABQ8NAQ6_PYRGI|nr:hypothetical protein MCOR01_000118 [Pyricularia oryzae]KAI6294110.1 hypothetical protein MCOR33_008681 [Pyricularia grisea]KAH9428178.1 hypothetical protein MCOR02_011666 [Pyricularia oryzae]KAI6263019.1 hypothetical protein MCOR19_000832 [Pyricularia oryzae]KAI6267586.1 hypothetical protein MCOR26_009644 [Pyricularia oryzae]
MEPLQEPKLPAPTSEPPTTTFLKLPPEICNNIVAKLSPSSQICLSLTCKELYKVYFIGKKYLNGALNVTHNVLHLLERDLPGYYFCSSCIKLHRWKLRRDGTVRFIDQCKQGPERTVFNLPSRMNIRYRLDWRIVRLAHLYQMYGQEHGVPLSYLEKSSRTKLSLGNRYVEKCRRALLHEHWEAKFVKGDLLLRTTYTLTSIDRADEPWKEIMDFLSNEVDGDLYLKDINLICSEFALMGPFELASFDFEDPAAEGPVYFSCRCEGYEANRKHERLRCWTFYEASRMRDADTGGWKYVLVAFRTLSSKRKSDRHSDVALCGWDDLEFKPGGINLWEDDHR